MNPPSPTYLGPPYRSSGTGNKPINRVVVHCTVSPCKPGGARDIARYFRGSSAGGSAHYVVDPSETVQSAWDSVVCWHAPPNSHSLGVELCDPMAGPDSRWQDDAHQSMLKRAAVLVAQLCLAYDVPITRLSPSELQAGKRGITGHVDVSNAWHQSSHWDPGPGFPWDQFMTFVRASAADLQNTPTIEKDWFDMATEADLKKIVNDALADATPSIAKAAAQQVLAARVTHVEPGGKSSKVSLATLLKWVNQRGQRIEQKVATKPQADDAGKATGA